MRALTVRVTRLLVLSAAALSALALAVPASAEDTVIRIGYQKSSTLIAVLRSNGELEKALAQKGVKLSWSEFTSGVPLTEALNVGSVDLSGDVADTVPIFAQAAGARLSYFAQESASPTAQAILVPKDSPINSVAELKGKKLAVAKGAGAHYLIIAALATAGLKFSDIEPAYLTPADARAAFERGAVDAWSIWDPFQSAAQLQSGARVLINGDQGLASYKRYYLASTAFTKAHPEVVELVYAQLAHTGHWIKAHPDDAAKLLAPVWGLDEQVITLANSRRSYEIGPVKPEYLIEQQKIADAFFSAQLLPKAVDAKTLPIWSPK